MRISKAQVFLSFVGESGFPGMENFVYPPKKQVRYTCPTCGEKEKISSFEMMNNYHCLDCAKKTGSMTRKARPDELQYSS